MRKRLLLLLPLLSLAVLPASMAGEQALQQRIVELEKRVANLETRLAPVLEQERVKEVARQQKELAHKRIMMDADRYMRYDLDLIEKAYQTANEDWTVETAGKAVELLTTRYPEANRTGCAVLSRAQSIEGKEKLDLLQKAISLYSGCYYANGVQVGPYARLYLAMRYKRDGKHAKAAKLFREIRIDFPDAVDHEGRLLTFHLEGME